MGMDSMALTEGTQADVLAWGGPAQHGDGVPPSLVVVGWKISRANLKVLSGVLQVSTMPDETSESPPGVVEPLQDTTGGGDVPITWSVLIQQPPRVVSIEANQGRIHCQLVAQGLITPAHRPLRLLSRPVQLEGKPLSQYVSEGRE